MNGSWLLIEEYALRTPEELSQVYGLKLPVLLDERKEFLRRFYFEPSAEY